MTESKGIAGTAGDGNKAEAVPQSLAAHLTGLFYAVCFICRMYDEEYGAMCSMGLKATLTSP